MLTFGGYVSLRGCEHSSLLEMRETRKQRKKKIASLQSNEIYSLFKRGNRWINEKQKMKEVILRKYIGCSDCQEQWADYCPLCKQIGRQYKDENGRSYGKRLKITKKNGKDVLYLKEKYLTEEKYKKPKPSRPIQELPISIDNFFVSTKGRFQELKNIPKGFELFFSSKGSKYYTNKTKNILIRVSDHWGWGIRYCNWFLDGYERAHCGSWKKQYGEKIGKIFIDDLEPILIKN